MLQQIYDEVKPKRRKKTRDSVRLNFISILTRRRLDNNWHSEWSWISRFTQEKWAEKRIRKIVGSTALSGILQAAFSVSFRWGFFLRLCFWVLFCMAGRCCNERQFNQKTLCKRWKKKKKLSSRFAFVVAILESLFSDAISWGRSIVMFHSMWSLVMGFSFLSESDRTLVDQPKSLVLGW